MSTQKLRTALLTTGSGPLPLAAFETLRACSDLRGVVFSRRKRRVPRWRRVQEYGLWYTGQALVGQLLGMLSGARVQIRAGELPSMVWANRRDETAVLSHLDAWGVDVVFVCSFQHILRPAFFTHFQACINIHPSLLPAYRGPEPIAWGILEGAELFGVTLHLVDEGIDTGAIVCQAAVKRPFFPLIYLVEQKLAAVLPPLIEQTVDQLAAGKLNGQPQSGGFYRPAPTLANRRR
jgi:folate-dependent phosphoribosylglycinamide formyltransferase PurN